MKIIKRYKDSNSWEYVDQDECLKYTEGSGYYKDGTVLDLLKSGFDVETNWAIYRKEII